MKLPQRDFTSVAAGSGQRRRSGADPLEGLIATAQSDAVPKNLFVQENGRMILFDLDIRLGRPPGRRTPALSRFLPGQVFGFKSKQAKREELPCTHASVVRALAPGVPSAASEFGLSSAEEQMLVSRARGPLREPGRGRATLRLMTRGA